MLYDAVTHASQLKCEVVVVMTLWVGYPPYRNFLRGGHLPNSCTNRKLTHISFRAHSPTPAFTGLHNFYSCIFPIYSSTFPIKSSDRRKHAGGLFTEGYYICNDSS